MNHINARVTASGSINGRMSASGDVRGAASAGTILVRDGTNNYEQLMNLPSIEGVTLKGDKTLTQIGVETITEQEIDKIIYG